MKKILVVNVCAERLHELEFVKPVIAILEDNNFSHKTINYRDLKEKDIEECRKIIICGTSLADYEYLKKINKLNWIKDIDKPILGICAGMQIIGLIFGGRIKKKKEIGFFHEDFKEVFLGLRSEQEVYHLHNNYVDFSDIAEFEIYNKGDMAQAVKHKHQKIYGVLFHPEVRQKDLIKQFCSL